jgi:hypothetical protein
MIKKNFPYLAIAILIIACLILLGILFKRQPAFSPDILSVTQPVDSLDGVVRHISGDTVQIQIGNMPGSPLPTRAPEDQLTYTIRITKNTKFRDEANRIYPLPSIIPPLPVVSGKEQLEVGMFIQAVASTDLRLLRTRSFDAKTLILPPTQKFSEGTVAAINGNGIQLKTEGKNFDLLTTAQTEYWLENGDKSDAKKITPGELKTGDKVVVFSDFPFPSARKMTALRLVILPSLSQTAGPMPTPKIIRFEPGQTVPQSPQKELTPLSPVSQINPEEYVAQ